MEKKEPFSHTYIHTHGSVSLSFRHNNSFIVLVTQNNEGVWTEHRSIQSNDKRGNSLNFSLFLSLLLQVIKCAVSNGWQHQHQHHHQESTYVAFGLGGVSICIFIYAYTIVWLVFCVCVASSVHLSSRRLLIKVPLPPDALARNRKHQEPFGWRPTTPLFLSLCLVGFQSK